MAVFADFIVPFITTALAELGDKTQIAIIALSTRTKKHLVLLSGVMLAFILTDGIAVLLGNYITKSVPFAYIRIASGIVFIIFGVITLLSREKDDTVKELENPFVSGFGIIFLSELGDKTQIAAGLFATKYNGVLVFLGVIFALAILSLLAVYLGKFIMEKLNRRVISYIAGAIFIIIGILAFLGI